MRGLLNTIAKLKIDWHRITLCCFATMVFASAVVAKDWRGIVPLKSTQADVERLLGPLPLSGYYNLSNEIVVFEFQTKPCDSFGIRWNVPPGTVTEIGIIPKGVHRKDEYQLAKDSSIHSDRSGFASYSDNEAGLSVITYKDLVIGVTYYPKASEIQLQCPSVERCCFDPVSRFDEYGSLSFQDEKARLDNFHIQMQRLPTRGIIEVRGPSRKIRNQQMKRAVRAKRYLVKNGLEPERLLVADGGFSTTSFTRLSIYPIGAMIFLFPEEDPK